MTTIFDLAPICGLATGLLAGYAVGSRFGTVPGIVGAAFCGVAGSLCGRLLFPLTLRWLGRDPLKRKTTEQLRRNLHDPEFHDLTAVLLELGSRGEDLGQELSLVLDRLGSPQQETRSRAWHALRVVWPSSAKLLTDFRVEDGPDECKRKADKLRHAEPGAPQNSGPATPLGKQRTPRA